ncbi:MAG: alkaline phosphatase D family protein [Verrucomicrobiales bacterium]|nr:alkaline phosphatase D family protein [Verrucomicrobiales bacterium]
MIKRFSRRLGLKVFALGSLFGFLPRGEAQVKSKSNEDGTRLDRWDNTNDRIFLGGTFWANPMEDWKVANGWAECQVDAANRSIHSLTHQITDPGKGFSLSVRLQAAEEGGGKGGAGFRIGVKSELNEHRSNAFAKGGVDAGLIGDQLTFGKKSVRVAGGPGGSVFRLQLVGISKDGMIALRLQLIGDDGSLRNEISQSVSANKVLGNIALVSNFKGPKQRGEKKGFRFQDWRVKGDGFSVTPENQFGPLLWSMYSLSDSRSEEGYVMKISALTGPMGDGDSDEVELHLKRGEDWEKYGAARLHKDAWTATFRIPKWNEKVETPYRLVYQEKGRDGSETPSEWSGVIKANPEGRPLRLGALTCQNDYGFPYAPVAENLVKLDPDLLYFSGDQLYESHGGFGIIRDPAGPAILNYLRKFYQFGWSFREAMKNAPTLCIPDDHDVFQGNIWGEGGAKMKDLDKGASSKGGYREPARMVNTVHITNCAHHPDFYDPTPVEQGISVYYGDMVYGNVSFAILGDRQWKSGPERVKTGSGRADHVSDPDFDTSQLDLPGLVLLGDRQEEFLKNWGDDWRGHEMKVLLSQTVFSGVATHHGRENGYLKADLDSGGWPQTARNNAIRILRNSKALHVNGDQHLSSLSQYGVDQQRDGNWSFCTPAIAAGYPRWWRPDEVGMPHESRPSHGLENTGEYLDGFGNKTYVYAVGNPVVGVDKNRYKKAHEKGSGFGLVTIDTEAKTYRIECFRFLIDATDGKPSNQFPGWPVTIHQDENAGENRLD